MEAQDIKILIAGDWHSTIYEEPLSRAFKKSGATVSEFKWHDYFAIKPTRNFGPLSIVKYLFSKIQEKFLFGPIISRINKDLFAFIEKTDPDVIFLYKPDLICRWVIRATYRPGRQFLSYHNDDPFSAAKYRSRHYKALLELMDINFVYRPKNLVDVAKICNTKSEILLPYPDDRYIYPLREMDKVYDVIFIGHYENDGRDDVIVKLIEDPSIHFGLFGTGWSKSKHYNYITERLGEIRPLRNNAYNKGLNRCKVALCFFSKINNDKYTRRSFEIPASGTMLLSEYSIESAGLLRPNVEAMYFSDADELMSRTKYLLRNDSERESIALAGYEKVIREHTAENRVQQILCALRVNLQR